MPCLGLLCTRCTGTCVDLGYHSGCSEIKSSKHKVFKKKSQFVQILRKAYQTSFCMFCRRHCHQQVSLLVGYTDGRCEETQVEVNWDLEDTNCFVGGGHWMTFKFRNRFRNHKCHTLDFDILVSKPKMSHSGIWRTQIVFVGGGALRLRVSFLIVVW